MTDNLNPDQEAMSTETKSLAAKITPGKAFIDEGVNGEAFVAVDERNLADFLSNTEEEWANAALYAEAHNVANETGMTPRELLAKLREAEAENARLVEECHRMAAILVTDDDLGPRRELAEKDDFEDPFNGGFSDESNPTLTLPADEH